MQGVFFFFQAEDGIRDLTVTGVQTCALPIYWSDWHATPSGWVARSTGVNGYTLHDGDIEGWTYTSTFGAPPPAVRFAQVCAAAAPTVVATHSATAPAAVSAAPTATATPA